jgi:hypothetical protein
MRIPKLLPAVRTPRLAHRGPLLQTLEAEVAVPAGEAHAGAFGGLGGEGAVADCAVRAQVGDVGRVGSQGVEPLSARGERGEARFEGKFEEPVGEEHGRLRVYGGGVRLKSGMV